MQVNCPSILKYLWSLSSMFRSPLWIELTPLVRPVRSRRPRPALLAHNQKLNRKIRQGQSQLLKSKIIVSAGRNEETAIRLNVQTILKYPVDKSRRFRYFVKILIYFL